MIVNKHSVISDPGTVEILRRAERISKSFHDDVERAEQRRARFSAQADRLRRAAGTKQPMEEENAKSKALRREAMKRELMGYVPPDVFVSNSSIPVELVQRIASFGSEESEKMRRVNQLNQRHTTDEVVSVARWVKSATEDGDLQRQRVSLLAEMRSIPQADASYHETAGDLSTFDLEKILMAEGEISLDVENVDPTSSGADSAEEVSRGADDDQLLIKRFLDFPGFKDHRKSRRAPSSTPPP